MGKDLGGAFPAARQVFEAWTTPDHFKRWWTPKSFGLTIVSCEMDVRVGGGYRLMITPPGADQPMAFFGNYLEVTPPSRLVWTNDEGGEEGAVSTATFEQRGNETLFTLHELHPSMEALDRAMASMGTSCYAEQFGQLDALLVS